MMNGISLLNSGLCLQFIISSKINLLYIRRLPLVNLKYSVLMDSERGNKIACNNSLQGIANIPSCEGGRLSVRKEQTAQAQL